MLKDLKSLGFRMPAEWEKHASTWFSWVHKEESWPGKFELIPPAYALILATLSRFETVNVNVKDAEMESFAKKLIEEKGGKVNNVQFHHFPTNDSWCRDHGPIYVKKQSGEKAIIDWRYNAWGGKYPPFDLDDEIPVHIAKLQDLPLYQPGIVMEGGSIEVNGKGSLITSKACLLNPNRNPHLTQKEIEEYLCLYLGIEQVLWVNDGIVGDDTDGHIDDMTRFVDERTILTCVENNIHDENHVILEENLELLKKMKDLNGNSFEIVTLPMPDPVVYEEQRLPASYANFLIANDCVLVPTFRCQKDEQALDIIQDLFQNREVIGLDCTDIIWGLGAIHCLSQQEPA
ncbi:MAG: agmatine deiminase family protein [Cytophagales bacterium]